jgi:hypothetical protein
MKADEDDPKDDEKTNPKGPKAFKARIERCKRARTELVDEWAKNVDFRRGKPFTQETDEDRINVNLDWSLTKGKHAQLYSQTPKVYLTAKEEKFKQAIVPFGKRLNDVLTQASVGCAMDESVLDAINASGIGAVIVSMRASTVKKMVPLGPQGEPLDLPDVSPEDLQLASDQGLLTLEEINDVIDVQFTADRFSPSDLLWDVDFVGSNFDHSDWIGKSGRLPWSLALLEFGEEAGGTLREEHKDKVLGEVAKVDNLRDDGTGDSPEQMVEYDEVFYWAYRFDPTEKYFKRIRRIVFVKGLEQPVIDEPWKGQLFNEQTKTYAGVCEFPISVLTLTYISDDAIPPSDSAIGRPQILEMIKSRTQIIQQRDRSQPFRWGNTDRLDPMVIDNINQGKIQNIIPVQGDGARAIGEVSRASHPPENNGFDLMIKGDLQEQWQVSSNQIGSQNQHGQSATEAGILQQNFQTRIGQERSRVESHLAKVARIMAGLLALHDKLDIPGLEELQAADPSWDKRSLANEYVFYLRPDSTVLLDSKQRIQQLKEYLNLTGQSGYINPKLVIEEMTALHGLDTDGIVIDPTPPAVDPPKMSFTFGGAADLMNPLVVAMLLKNDLGPSPEDLQAAMKLLQAAGIPLALQPQNPAESGLEVPPTDAELEMQQQAEMEAKAVESGSGGGADAPPMNPQDASKGKEWGLMPRITKRVEDF